MHLVDQALLLFGPARHVYAEFVTQNPLVHVVDDVFVAITHTSGVLSHLFTSPNVGILGPRLTVLGSEGAYVKYGIDPQEEALLAGGIPGLAGLGRGAESSWGRLGAGDDVLRSAASPATIRVLRRRRAGPPRRRRPAGDDGEGVAMMDVLEAARLSAREQRVVELGQ